MNRYGLPARYAVFVLALLLGPIAKTGCAVQESLVPVQLRTEYRVDPLGINTPAPRLGWELQPANPDVRGRRQTAYRVLVASTPEALRAGDGDLWDSGKVASEASLHVEYEGAALPSGLRAYWTVRVWDEEDRPSAYSEAAWWEMGLLREEDWEGTWIGRGVPPPAEASAFYDEDPAPLLRKAFRLGDAPVARARVYVSGLGYYELRLNGEKVGDHVLDPGWTDYEERVYYAVYDVTRQLQTGDNVLGVMLGNGWYDPVPMTMFGQYNLRETLPVGEPKVILQLNVTYADGTTQHVVTDTSWTVGDSPYLKNNIYLGEVYDARREQPGWDRAGFDERGWTKAVAVAPPGGVLQAQDLPPIKVMRAIDPVAVTEPEPGVYVFDMGQNFAGWITLRLQGEAGARVRLRFGELLHPDGTLNTLTTVAGQHKDWRAVTERDWAAIDSQRVWLDGPYEPRTAWQSDLYILKGGEPEVYTPRFTWHGFRYVEVRGYPGTPTLDDMDGHLLHSAVTPVGTFAGSNDLFNRIQEVTRWTQLSNMFGVQSDCPHRERYGYGGDIVAASEMALLNLDMARFYAKAVHDFADAAKPNGGFTEIAPDVGIDSESLGDGTGPVGWGTAHPMLVRQLYQYYGDRRLLAEQYGAVRRWVDFLASRADGHILDNGISDHESLVPKPKALTGTAFFYYSTRLLVQMAQVLERREDVETYTALAGAIQDAFNRRFLDPATGRYGPATQAAQAFALYMDLVPPETREAALGVLVDSILVARDGHLTTGIFGTKYLLNVLTHAGRADVAYTVANQRTYPGWGYMLENGATTLWEAWRKDEYVMSHNHPMFGSVSEWFFKALAGIRPAPDAVGFDRVIIQPNIVGDLTWAQGHHDSVRGRIESAWRVDAGRLTLDVVIPVSATATVFVPAGRAEDVTEGGVAAQEAPGVTFLRMEAGAAVYSVEAGRYHFVVEHVTRG